MPRDSEPCDGGGSQPARQRLMRICALATGTELEAALAALAPLPTVETVRQPEIGLVMLQGRIGGDGRPFNVGEATVTRAVVRLASGELGFSYLLGRSHQRARAAAIIDALGQSPAFSAAIESALVAPVEARIAAENLVRQAETAATRVQFFTLVRGED